MKKSCFNFFESPTPHPRQCSYNPYEVHPPIEKSSHYDEDHDIEEDRLFATPQRLNTQVITSPVMMMDPHLYSSHPRSRHSRDITFFGDDRRNSQLIQQQSQPFIKEKIDFSEQEKDDLLAHLTPAKVEKYQAQLEPYTTVKKVPYHMITPSAEPRNTERGLKKLASQAFRLVTKQRKTTYQYVAKKLTEDMIESCQSEQVCSCRCKKRGEQNIKRRVYDALNVLIALGIFKRHGHRIFSKKMDCESLPENYEQSLTKQRLRQEELQRQRQSCQQMLQKKTSRLEQKKVYLRQTRQKFQKLRSLRQKNINSQHIAQEVKINFPLVVITQSTQKQVKETEEKPESQDISSLHFWKQSQSEMGCSFNSKKVRVMGELDLIRQWAGESCKLEPKSDRLRRKLK